MGKSNYKTLFKNLIFFFISSVATKLIGYILLPIYTANMTTEQYGIADILMSTNNLIYPIIMLGMGGAVVRYCMEEQKDKSLSFSSALIVLLFSSLLSTVMIPVMQIFSDYGKYAVLLPIMAFTLNCTNLISSLCKAVDKTSLIAKSNAVYGVILLATALLLVKFLKLGVYGYLLSYILADLISGIYLAVSVKIGSYVKFKYKKIEYQKQIKRMLRYGVPLVPNSLAWWITQLSDRYMVTYWHGNAVNGLYSVAYKIPSIVKTIVNIFIQAWQLSVIQEHEKEDAKVFYDSIYKMYTMLCYIATAGLIVMVKPLAMILFSNDFYVAWKYVPLLLIAAAINSQEAFFSTFYLAGEKTTQYFIASVIGAGTNVILNFILIPQYSATGATIATAISYFVVYVQRVFFVKRTMNMNIYFAKNITTIGLLGIEAFLYTSNGIKQIYSWGGAIIIAFIIMLLYINEIREFVSYAGRILKGVLKNKGIR